MAAFEGLVNKAYTATNEEERKLAGAQLSKFTNFEFWKQILLVLRASKNPYTLHFCAQNLKFIFTEYFASFSAVDRLEFKNALLAVLHELADVLCTEKWSNIVRPVLIECLCRFDKLCRVDNPTSNHFDIADVSPFFQKGVPHLILGIGIFEQLISEMSTILPKIPLPVQRKITIAFRDKFLFEIVRIGFEKLEDVVRFMKTMEKHKDIVPYQILLKEVLELLSNAFTFDFIGINTDPNSDDIGVIHVPEPWAPIMEDPNPLSLIFNLYEHTSLPYSVKCLEILEKMVAVRDSIFSNDDQKSTFLSNFIFGLGKIISNVKEFNSPHIVHQIARILARLKANYQIRQIVDTRHYSAFIRHTAEFSIQLFSTPLSMHTLFYLLSFWNRMVSAAYHIRLSPEDCSTHLNEIVPKLLVSLVKGIGDLCASSTSDNPLDNEHLASVLGEIPSIARYAHQEVTASILGELIAIMKEWGGGGRGIEIESKLSWMIWMGIGVMGGKNGTGVRGSLGISEFCLEGEEKEEEGEAELLLEGQLVGCLFEAMGLHDAYINKFGLNNVTPRLELAFIGFLQRFCKLYLLDLSSTGIYQQLQRLDLGSVNNVIECIVKKTIMIIRFWSKNMDIIEETLGSAGLFWTLASGYSTSKVLVKSPIVCHLLEHHNEVDLPFGEDTYRVRCSFYKTLGCLLWSLSSTTDFNVFINPFNHQLNHIQNQIQNNHPSGYALLGQLLNDLKGVNNSMLIRDSYNKFFNWFFIDNGYYEWLGKLIASPKQYSLTMHHCWQILKFCCEFVLNENRRISFGQNSADGLKLFRVTAQMLSHYAKLLTSTEFKDLDDQYTSYKLYIRCLVHIMSGGYTNFGVFELYSDPILSETLSLALNVILHHLPYSLANQYPKIFTLIFALLSSISVHHSNYLLSLPPQSFRSLLMVLRQGLNSTNREVLTETTNALDKLFSLHTTNMILISQHNSAQNFSQWSVTTRRNAEMMTSHINSNYSIVMGIFTKMMEIGCSWYEPVNFLARALLAFIVLFQKEFKELTDVIINSQSGEEERVVKLKKAFMGLMEDVKVNLYSSNQERFLSNLTTFHIEVQNLLNLNEFYKSLRNYNKDY
uniref:Exportin-7/Ran-binding protein 17 TPR repeats domain-containing protein n=1 Tax=Arcella intermedia TaxID=1963864 RepID=A0A6B2KWS9_9EUKA